MPCWSAENATKAYLTTLEMGDRGKEPDVAEFISALAAGNNAELMVVAGVRAADSFAQALVAAGHQTGGRVICILPTLQHLHASQELLGLAGPRVEFVIGEPQELLTTQYDAADFVLIDCNLHNHHQILRALDSISNSKQKGTVVVGYNYNAFSSRKGRGSGSWWWSSSGSKTQFLPIGEGLLVTKFGGNYGNMNTAKNSNNGYGITGKVKRSRWIVKVDKCTGEEHVFRVRFPQDNVIQA